MPAPKKYDAETQERAVRMYRDRLARGETSQLAARVEVGELLDVNESTLRNWIRREDATGTSATAAAGSESADQELARLRREPWHGLRPDIRLSQGLLTSKEKYRRDG